MWTISFLIKKNYFKWGSKLSLSLSKVLISDNQSRPLREIEKWRCFLPLNPKFELTRDFLSADAGFHLYEMLETFYYHFSILHEIYKEWELLLTELATEKKGDTIVFKSRDDSLLWF